jgi:hypothetical protein
MIDIVISIAITMQEADKQTPVSMQQSRYCLDYNNGNGVFYVVNAKLL